MAPNLKILSLLTDNLSSEIDAFHTKFALPSATPSYQRQQQAKKAEESASYWDWPTEVPAEQTLSLEHIESNLIQSAAALSETSSSSSTNAESDDYWNEAPQQRCGSEQDIPANYWDEAVHDSDDNSDNYWNMPTADTLTESDQYWSWSHDASSSSTQQDSDAYWVQ